MPAPETTQVAVEVVSENARLIRVAGVLDCAGAARLTRVVDAQFRDADRTGRRVLVVDIGGIREFAAEGAQILRRVCEGCRQARIEIYLTGHLGHIALMPVRVRQVVAEFSTRADADEVLAELAEHT